MQQCRDNERIGVVGIGRFFVDALLDEVIEVILDEIFIENLEAVKEVKQVDQISIQLEFTYP
jgi:hypothetical protein